MFELFKLVALVTVDGLERTDKQLAAVEKSVKRAEKEFAALGKTMTKIGTELTEVLTAPIVGVAAALGSIALKVGDAAEKLNNLSSSSGLSAKSLQEMQHVANVAGIEFSGFVQTVQRLQTNLPAIVKGTGTAASIMRQLGISVYDAAGQLKSMDALFPQIINGLQSIRNPTERNTAAHVLFGRSVADLQPILAMSSAEFNQMREEADRMGLVMGGPALQAAAEFNDSVDELKEGFSALGIKIATAVIPILQDTIVPIIENQVIPAISKLVGWVQSAAQWFDSLSPGLRATIVEVAAFAAALGPAIVAVGLLTKALAVLPATIGFLAGPWGWLIAACAALVVAGIAVYNNWNTVQEFLIKSWQAVAYAAEQSFSWVQISLLNLIRNIVSYLANLLEKLPFVSEKVEKLRSAMLQTIDALITSEEAERDAREKSREETKRHWAELDKLHKLQKENKKATEEQTNALKNLNFANDEEVKTLQKRLELEARFKEMNATPFEKNNMEWKKAIDEAKKIGADTTEINKYYAVERIKIVEKEAGEYLDKLAEKLKLEADIHKQKMDDIRAEKDARQKQIQSELSFAGNYAQGWKRVLDQVNENELQKIDNKTRAEIQAVTDSTMAQKDKDAAIAKIEKTADDRKRAIAKRQAVEDKVFALFEIAINTAMAIVKALPNIPLSIAIGVLGAAEAATVVARPLPMARGALVPAQSGGVLAQVGEGREDEIVMPVESGISKIVNGIMGKMAEFKMPSIAMPGGFGIAAAGAGGGHAYSPSVTLQVGTLIADETGLKNLERKLNRVRIGENQRRGLG